MTRTRTLTIALITLFAATAAFASWYDDYETGIAAVRKGQWQVVVQKMSSAIKGNPKEGDNTRTYGAIFINYHPYYYRGIAHMNLGQYEQAISDFEKTSGPGEVNQGPLEVLMQRAKTQLAESSAPPTPEPQPQRPPAPVPVPVPVPLPVQPAAPVIDPALRQQVANEINAARGRLSAAQQRKATGAPQFAQATQALADANTRSATARSNDELRVALASAQNAALLFDAAPAPGAPTPTVVATATASSRPAAASTVILADTNRRVRQALQSYFNGEFEEASRAFEDLTTALPKNGWIYAFLGASQYSVYAFEIDESYKTKAVASFKQAKRYGKFNNELPEKYFSRRIRNAFRMTASQ
ncbi:MAG: tetratricopeptide repeat protein [Acidobacteriota bacterium]